MNLYSDRSSRISQSSNSSSSNNQKIKRTMNKTGSLAFITKDMSKNLESRVVTKLDELMTKINIVNKKRMDAKEKYDNASKEIEKLDKMRADKLQVNQIMKKAVMKFKNNKSKNNNSEEHTFFYGLDLQELKLINNENDRLITEASKWRSIYERKNKKYEQLHRTLDSIIVLIQQCKVSCEEEEKAGDDSFTERKIRLNLITEQ